MPFHMPEDYEAEEDLRTLRRADEIRADAKRMAAAKAMAEKLAQATGKESDSEGSLRQGYRRLG